MARRRQAPPFTAFPRPGATHRRGSWPGDSRRVLSDRKDQAMARTPPIPAPQPPDATRTAAGHVAAVAAVQAAASLTLAALLRPLTPAARAAAGLASALGPRPLLRPLPARQAAVLARAGGARRAAPVAGGPPGTGRAASPV